MTPIVRSLLVAPILAAFLLVGVILSTGPAGGVTIEKILSPGGITAWLVRDHSNPIISMRFSFRGGAGLDPKNRIGLANILRMGLKTTSLPSPRPTSRRSRRNALLRTT